MIERPASPMGRALLRGFAILLAVAPLPLWFGWALTPAADAWDKLPFFCFLSVIHLLLLGIAGGMYWWSFYETPKLRDLPLHAKLFSIYVAGVVGLILFLDIVTAIEFMFRRN